MGDEMDNTGKNAGDLQVRIRRLTNLLAETQESIKTAIGVELEYGDYSAVERLKDLKVRIEEEINVE